MLAKILLFPAALANQHIVWNMNILLHIATSIPHLNDVQFVAEIPLQAFWSISLPATPVT